MAKKGEWEEKKPDVYLDVLKSLVSAPDQGHAILRGQYDFDSETGKQVPSKLVSEVSGYIANKTGGNKETIEHILPTLWGVEFYRPMIEGALALKTPELNSLVNSEGVLDWEKVVQFLATEEAAGQKVGAEAYKLAGQIESAVSERAKKIDGIASSFEKKAQAALEKGYSELTKLEEGSPAYKALESKLSGLRSSAESYLSTLNGIKQEIEGIQRVGEEIVGLAVQAGQAKYALGDVVSYSEVLGLKRKFKDTIQVAGNLLEKAKKMAVGYLKDAVAKAEKKVKEAVEYRAPALAY